jgi:hypothetical protein
MDASSVDIVHQRLVRRKFVSKLTNWTPVVEFAILDQTESFRVTALRLILVISLHLLLVYPHNVQIHLTHLTPSVLEPESIIELVNVKTVLLHI